MGSDMLVANKDAKTMLHAELGKAPGRMSRGGVGGKPAVREEP